MTPTDLWGSKYNTSKSNLINENSSNLLPEEVLKRAHEGLIIEGPIGSTISYFPIWRYDGNRFNARVGHWIHFDILIRILSNVFVEFRKEFTKLITVELHISEVKKEDLHSITLDREHELKLEIEILNRKLNEKDITIENLKSTLDETNSRFALAMTKFDKISE